jgi:hypothetical protein
MSFFQYYILFGISGLTILTTFSLPHLFSRSYEKIGLTLLYLIIIFSIVFNIDKWHLLWLAPLAFIIPYYSKKILLLINLSKD